MPTVLKEGPYRFFFYAAATAAKRLTCMWRDDKVAKFWLVPVRLSKSGGFGRAELRRIEKLVIDKRETLMERWNGFFGD